MEKFKRNKGLFLGPSSFSYLPSFPYNLQRQTASGCTCVCSPNFFLTSRVKILLGLCLGSERCPFEMFFPMPNFPVLAHVPRAIQCACSLSPGGIAICSTLCFVLVQWNHSREFLMLGPGPQTMNSKSILFISWNSSAKGICWECWLYFPFFFFF